MNHYACPECESDRVSHVQTGTAWSSQCLACAHVWGTTAYTRARVDEPAVTHFRAETETKLHADDANKEFASDTVRLKITKSAIAEPQLLVKFGPFYVRQVECSKGHQYGLVEMSMEFVDDTSRNETIRYRTLMPQGFDHENIHTKPFYMVQFND